RLQLRKPTPVERLLVAYHAPEVGHPDSYPLQVVEAALTTGKTSRLYRRLTEGDRSVTAVHASYTDHIDPTLFTLRAEIKPGHTAEEVERALYEEIARLEADGLSTEEL